MKAVIYLVTREKEWLSQYKESAAVILDRQKQQLISWGASSVEVVFDLPPKALKAEMLMEGLFFIPTVLGEEYKDDVLSNGGELKNKVYKVTTEEELLTFSHWFKIREVEASTLSCVILDRDGVINVERGHITSLEELEIIEGVPQAIKKINSMGYKVWIATNQSGIARGLLTEDELCEMMDALITKIEMSGGVIEGYLYAPDHPDKAEVKLYRRNSFYRKSNPGMLVEILRRENLAASECVYVGDTVRDRDAANQLDMPFVGVRSSKYGEFEKDFELFDSLKDYVNTLVK